MEQRIKGTTGLMALIGSPVGHSGSPAMYNFSFRHHNLDYAYMAFDIKEDQVPAALDAIRLFKMRGANVTMPCKNEVAKHMDELSPAARIIGAVNTIVNEDGKLVGHITDGIGFVRNLKEHGVDVKGKKMVVLGAGGAATGGTLIGPRTPRGESGLCVARLAIPAAIPGQAGHHGGAAAGAVRPAGTGGGAGPGAACGAGDLWPACRRP